MTIRESVSESRKKKQTRNSLTAKGIGYNKVRSKIEKGPDGYGKVVSVAREKLMQKLGYDPGVDVVAQHLEPGAHFEKDGGAFKKGTRSENTAESNSLRAALKKRRENGRKTKK